MSLQDAFAPAEAAYREQVKEETWGHLAPVEHQTYRGYLVFAVGCFGSDHLNPTALEFEFEGLDSSPWLYNAMADFLSEQRKPVGGVYRFDGTVTNYEFAGTVRRLRFAVGPDKH